MHLTGGACVERMLGRLIVADDQLLECGPLVTNHLRDRLMYHDAILWKAKVESAHLGLDRALSLNNLTEPWTALSRGSK
jgi:hypothetical protein